MFPTQPTCSTLPHPVLPASSSKPRHARHSANFPCQTAQIAEINQMPLFTRENAAIMSAKGNLARWSRPRQPAEPPAIPAPVPQPIPEAPETFAARRLKRVREQLDAIDALMLNEDDPKRLKEYADATARLSAQEFDLSGRPKSGSRRPSADPKGRKSDWWIEMQPSAPAQVQPALPAPPTVVLVAEVQPVQQAPYEPLRLPGDVTP